MKSKLLLIAFIASAALLTACGNSSPESVIQDFFQKINSGEIEKAKQLVEPNIAQAWGDKLDYSLQAGFQRFKDCGGLKSVKSEQVSSGDAIKTFKVTAEAKTSDAKPMCKTETQNMRVANFEGKWYIYLF